MKCLFGHEYEIIDKITAPHFKFVSAFCKRCGELKMVYEDLKEE